MGLPIEQLVVATNQNDILHRCLSGEGYFKGETIPSISPSMDIQVSSNFERALFEVYDRDGGAVAQLMDELKGQGGFRISQGALERLRGLFASGRCSEDETLAMIARANAQMGELLCPHSAVGVHVADMERRSDRPMITLGTAHPAKFPAAVNAAAGVNPALPERLADLHERPERYEVLANDQRVVEEFISARSRA